MSDTVDVDPDVLAEHASAVRSFMGELRGATSNASDTVDPHVYGIVNLATAQILQLWVSSAAGFLDRVVTAGDAVADAVSAMADDYRRQEEQNRQSFTAIHQTLGEGGR